MTKYSIQYLGKHDAEPPEKWTPTHTNNYVTSVPISPDTTTLSVRTYLYQDAVDAELPEGVTEEDIAAAVAQLFWGCIDTQPFTTGLTKPTKAWFQLNWTEQ